MTLARPPVTSVNTARRASERPCLRKTSEDISLLVKNMNSWTVANLQRKWLTLMLLSSIINPLAKAMRWVMFKLKGQNSCSKEVLKNRQGTAHRHVGFIYKWAALTQTLIFWSCLKYLLEKAEYNKTLTSSHAFCSQGHRLSIFSGPLRNQLLRGWALPLLCLARPA